jgi:hypothetical protein
MLSLSAPEHREFDDVAALAHLPLVSEQPRARKALNECWDGDGKVDNVLAAIHFAPNDTVDELKLNWTVDEYDLPISDHALTPEARAEADSANREGWVSNLTLGLTQISLPEFSVTSPSRVFGHSLFRRVGPASNPPRAVAGPSIGLPC